MLGKSCPVSCTEQTDTAGRFLFPDVTSLAACNQTMLLDMAIHSGADDGHDGLPAIRACAADYEMKDKLAFVPEQGKASLCTTANSVMENATVHLHRLNIDNAELFSVHHLLAAGRQVANRLASEKPSCTKNAIELAYFQSAAIALYAGAEVHQHGLSSNVLHRVLEYAQDNTLSKPVVVQLCAPDGRGADYSIGVVAAGAKNLPFIHQTVKTWANGGCVPHPEAGENFMTVTLRVPTTAGVTEETSQAFNNMTTPAYLGARSQLEVAADCKTTTVQSNDGCWSVAKRCGISQSDLEKYNRVNLCETLILGERVCCTSGTLPSTLPPGNPDGTCKTRSVMVGDSCGSMASKCGISPNDFTTANPKPDLCSTLAVGQPVCCTRQDARSEAQAGRRGQLRCLHEHEG